MQTRPQHGPGRWAARGPAAKGSSASCAGAGARGSVLHGQHGVVRGLLQHAQSHSHPPCSHSCEATGLSSGARGQGAAAGRRWAGGTACTHGRPCLQNKPRCACPHEALGARARSTHPPLQQRHLMVDHPGLRIPPALHGHLQVEGQGQGGGRWHTPRTPRAGGGGGEGDQRGGCAHHARTRVPTPPPRPTRPLRSSHATAPNRHTRAPPSIAHGCCPRAHTRAPPGPSSSATAPAGTSGSACLAAACASPPCALLHPPPPPFPPAPPLPCCWALC